MIQEQENIFEVAKKKKWLNDKVIARDIIKEILKFGVSQNQIRNIIFLLSLELEDINEMKIIASLFNDDNEMNEKKTILIPGENNE